jgi:hypothetical protein
MKTLCTILLISLIITSCGNRKSSDNTNQTQSLKSIAQTISLTIDSPESGDTISQDIYDDMKGGYMGDIPKNYTFWVLARDRYNYFIMYPQPTVALNSWTQSNIRLGSDGKWQLHVCLTDKEASNWFMERVNSHNFSGFQNIPQGALTIKYVDIIKE